MILDSGVFSPYVLTQFAKETNKTKVNQLKLQSLTANTTSTIEKLIKISKRGNNVSPISLNVNPVITLS